MKAAAFAVIVLFAVAICGPFLFFNQSLYLADLTYNYQPVVEYVRDHGKPWPFFPAAAPLWNPYIVNGVPQVAVTWPLLYWPSFIGFLFPGSVGQGVLIALHLIIGGGGVYLWYSRRFGVETVLEGSRCSATGSDSIGIAALLGALVAMLNGYIMGSTINLSLGSTAAWGPLVLYLIDRVLGVGETDPTPPTDPSEKTDPTARKDPNEKTDPNSRSDSKLHACAFVSLLALVLSQQLTAGRPEIFAGFAVVYAAYVAVLLVDLHFSTSTRKIVSGVALLMVAAVLAVGIGACNLLPLFELLKSTPPMDRLNPLGNAFWSAGWFDFAGLLLSQPLGDISPGNYTYYPTYPGSMPYISSLFVGAPVLILVVLGFARKTWRWRLFWLAILAAAILVSLGEFAPLIPFLMKQFPSLSLLRFPIKFAFFIIVPLSIAAIQGLDSAMRKEVQLPIVWTLLAAFLLSVPFIVRAWVSPDMRTAWVKCLSNMDDHTVAAMTPMVVPAGHTLVAEVTVQVFCGVLCCILIILISRTQSKVWQNCFALCIVSLSAGLLYLNGMRHLWHTVDMSFFNSESSIAAWIQQQEKQLPSMYRVLSLIEDPVPEPPILSNVPPKQLAENFMAYGRDILRPNTNIESNVRLSNGMTVVPTWSSLFLSNAVLPRSSQAGEVKHPAGVSDLPLKRYCRITSTRYVITLKSKVDDGGNYVDLPVLDQRLFRLLREDTEKNIRVYDAGTVRPRVAMISEFIIMPDRDAVLRELNRAPQDRLNSLKQAMVVGEPALSQQLKVASRAVYQTIDSRQVPLIKAGVADGDSKLTCVLEEQTAEHLRITADCSHPCLLVLSDSFFPGWTATDNGKEVPILLADGMQQSVILEGGRHIIEFSYKPGTYYVGLAFSAVFCLICVAGLLLGLLLSNHRRKAATL